ncbi:mobile mystery protein A [Marinihelvus fidelis]|uniref:Mobile mystery protein A n=1 Tax=Marinihelvus fidelis TaxID=2613842 RepID=A0A5N0TAW8_9GAMM|nr:mobile mystery protein A [Marinihelvus fidelis]KAA9130489.1 mobile mystery protein A [Marinihelvus fidelis]
MSVRDTARKQTVRLLDEAARQVGNVRTPPEGWLATLRKALRMPVNTLAGRLGVSRGAVYQAERNEREGAITINQLRKLADAMGGRLVYAIVPETSIADMVEHQARRKASGRVRRTNAHMALEQQSLPDEQARQRIEDLAEELARDMPADFWNDQ